MAEVHDWIRRRSILKTWIAQARTEKVYLERKIQEYLEARDLESISGSEGEGVSLGKDLVMIHEDSRITRDERLIPWLKELGYEGIVQTKPLVNAGTLKSVVSELIEKGEPLPEWVEKGIYVKRAMQIRQGDLEIPDLPREIPA